MTKAELIEAIAPYPDDINISFVKYPSLKPIAFWDAHEWFVCEKKYVKGPPDQKFLAIMVEDE